jgi:hypothetical protein
MQRWTPCEWALAIVLGLIPTNILIWFMLWDVMTGECR